MKKTATVVGLGVSGAGAALLLGRKGWRVRVTEGSDTPQIRESAKILKRRCGGIEFEIGSHAKDFIKGSGLVVTSPGPRPDARPIVWAQELRIPVIDEIELGYMFCPGRIIAVTGTNGKSTTVTLIGGMLKAAGINAVVCGNIGVSFCEQILSFKKDTVAVLEASSFQLQRTDKFRPYVAMILNITQNHLDRHRDLNEYASAKIKIFKNQKKSDWAIINGEDKNLKGMGRHIKPRILSFGRDKTTAGAYVEGGCIYAGLGGAKSPTAIIGIEELSLKEDHNVRNAMAAILAGLIFRVEPEVIRKFLSGFRGLCHRCEYAGRIRGVRFINDSKATTVDAAANAIASMDGPVVLIAGGRDKGSDFTVLRTLIEQRVKAVVLIGEARQKMRTQLMGAAPIYEAQTMADALRRALALSKNGDTVLLSPMCASFDMYKNFEDRGDVFKKAVKDLSGRNEIHRAELCVNLRT